MSESWGWPTGRSRGRVLVGCGGREDGEDLRESFGGASARVRVFNLNLQIKIEGWGTQ